MRNKVIAGFVALLLAFGGGFYAGHVQFPPTTDVDPQVYFDTIFTPFENGTDAYLQWLDQHAHKSLYVADYTFTNERIAEKYIELKTKRGTDLHVLLDLSESRAVAAEQPLIERMRAAGIEVVIGTSPTKGKIMHNKFSIADMLWVEDGSWNYTDPADDQANTLNMNKVPSPLRAGRFKHTWDQLHDFMKQQQDRRETRSHSRH